MTGRIAAFGLHPTTANCQIPQTTKEAAGHV